MSILSVRQLHIMGKHNHIVKDLSLDVQGVSGSHLSDKAGAAKA